jgi:hypothetical protein
MSDRRETLRILGAIGSTCAFPYSADELYGQHAHAAPAAAPAKPAPPAFFTAREFETVQRLADLIIPPTSTPGASASGVPLYIDVVVNSSERWRQLFRSGLQWLDAQSHARHGKRFHEIGKAAQVAMLTPICEAADRLSPAAVPRSGAPLEVEFFKAFKSMTADGYFTSKTGLVDTLGYKGNTVLAEFPSCADDTGNTRLP